LGGYTGDALGAAIETAEVLYELSALVVLHFATA
jgi:cobalamin synthase